MNYGSATTSQSSATDLENSLAQIRGVYASCVILDSGKGPSEIHIVASTERKPKQMVRDIETLLYVKHRVKVDYRKISLVQLPDDKLLNIPLARPEIRLVTEQVLGDEKRIVVEIQGAGRTAAGEAAERLEHPMPFQTSAKATINALEKLLHNAVDVRLESAETFRLGPREILLVVVTCTSDNGEETFVGASFVGARPVESAARATLDALNRRIYNLSLQAPRQPDEIAQLPD